MSLFIKQEQVAKAIDKTLEGLGFTGIVQIAVVSDDEEPFVLRKRYVDAHPPDVTDYGYVLGALSGEDPAYLSRVQSIYDRLVVRALDPVTADHVRDIRVWIKKMKDKTIDDSVVGSTAPATQVPGSLEVMLIHPISDDAAEEILNRALSEGYAISVVQPAWILLVRTRKEPEDG